MQTIQEAQPDAVVVSGDISTARRLYRDLSRFSSIYAPTYFVLGNHDRYGGDFASVDATIERAENDFPNLCRLGAGLVVYLRPELALVGSGGWGDGRAGAARDSNVSMNDSLLIADLVGLDRHELFQRLNELGDESARDMEHVIEIALDRADHVIICTHVPPFAAAARHRGQPGTSEYLPHFTNVALGETLLKIAEENPVKSFTVLCGHTHALQEYRVGDNLWVRVAGAAYGQPAIADILYL